MEYTNGKGIAMNKREIMVEFIKAMLVNNTSTVLINVDKTIDYADALASAVIERTAAESAGNEY